MGDNASARSVLRKIIVTTVLGVISFPFTQLLFESLPGQIVTAGAFGGIVLLAQFLVDFERRLGRVEQQLMDSVDEIRHVVRQGFSSVNNATQLMAQVETAGLATVAVTELMQHAGMISPQAPPLVSTLAQVEIDRVSRFLHELANQETKYEGEDHDWLLSLTRSATKSIDAISLPEVDAARNSSHGFWESALGRHYLDLQKEAVRRGVRVRRIFVTERDEIEEGPGFQHICRTQAELGIEVRVLCPSSVPRAFRRSLFDFIVFDNTLSYEVTIATHVEPGETPMILNTRLILLMERVAERIEKYQKIWTSAEPWIDPQGRTSVPVPYRSPESGNQLLEEGRP